MTQPSAMAPSNGRPAALAASSAMAIPAGISSAPQLEVPLPAGGPGLYELAIRSGSYQTEAPLVASSNHPRGGVLVVLPALTWQGQNVADDDGDGIPDALDAGGPVSLARPLAAGLPAGFIDEAAFLAYLDRAHLPYDLTTDLGLIDGVGPGMFGHSALVFAGAERWVPPSLATPLKSYLAKGGRVLSLGIDSLRRAVVVQGTKASDPSAPTQADVLGAEPSLGPPGALIASELLAALPAASLLLAGSSMPVRDLALAAPRQGVTVVSNRGAAGIDGTVSTALGAALAWQAAGGGRAFALLGDLTFLHDANGLVLGPDETRPDLTIVVVNNDGGAIFSLLEQGSQEFAGVYERVFGTPHRASLAGLAAAARIGHTMVLRAEDLPAALKGDGIRIVEVPADRAGGTALRRRLAEAAAAAVTALL